MDRSLILLLMLSFALGLACWLLFIWGVKKGEFDDMERPKYRMLDDDATAPAPEKSSDSH